MYGHDKNSLAIRGLMTMALGCMILVLAAMALGIGFLIFLAI